MEALFPHHSIHEMPRSLEDACPLSPTPLMRSAPPQGHFPFLKLPGEPRNRVYDYAIVEQDYQIGWVDSNHKSKSLTYRLPRLGEACGPRLEPGAARRRRHLDIPRNAPPEQPLAEDAIQPGPAALLVVCRGMHAEACTVFCSKSFFGFIGLGPLRHFFNNLSPVAKKSLLGLRSSIAFTAKQTARTIRCGRARKIGSGKSCAGPLRTSALRYKHLRASN